MNYHRLGYLNNKHLFPLDLESGKSKINAPADSASGSEMAFSLCLHLVEGARELSGVIFRRPINSFIRDLLSWINHLRKGSVHQYNHIGVQDFNIWICRGDILVWDSPGGPVVKNPPANAGDDCMVPGWGKCSGEENDNPLQCPSLRNPRDREA